MLDHSTNKRSQKSNVYMRLDECIYMLTYLLTSIRLNMLDRMRYKRLQNLRAYTHLI